MPVSPIKKVHALYNLMISRKGSTLILTHNNPDPDGLASAYALSYLLSNFWKFNTTLAYGGMIGRAENRAMVKHLKIKMTPIAEIRLKDFTTFALIDCQPGTGNIPLPEDIHCDIVIDHHFPIDDRPLETGFVDIRPDCGSTSSILTEYLKDAGLTEIDHHIATALIYGVRSDTRDFGRESSPKDMDANNFLYPWVDFRLLSNIEHPQLTREHLTMIAKTIERALIDGNVVVSDLQEISNTDALSEMADLLVRLEGVKWALCYGEFQGGLYFSLRMTGHQGHAGLLAKKIVAGLGSGGGHHLMAGGKIPLRENKVLSYSDQAEGLKKRFFKEINMINFKGKPL